MMRLDLVPFLTLHPLCGRGSASSMAARKANTLVLASARVLNCIAPNTSPLPFTPRLEDACFDWRGKIAPTSMPITNCTRSWSAPITRAVIVHRYRGARAVPGVLAVFTDHDLAPDKLNPLPCNCGLDAVSPLIPPRRALACGRVRQGDIFAMVVAKSLSARSRSSRVDRCRV